MFKLTERHTQALQAKADADFVRDVAEYLRENHHDTVVKLPHGEFRVADLPDTMLRKMIEGGIAQARGYGMTWRSTLIAFVVIMFVAAPNFDDDSEVSSVLNEDAEYPEHRIDNLWDRIADDYWTEIKEGYESNRWSVV